MNVAQLQAEIREFAAAIGIDKIGFTTAAPFVKLKDRLKQQQRLNYQSGFEEPDLDKRTNPLLLLDQAESIISIAVAYPSKMKDSPRGKKGERRGMFCRASWGEDYHTVLRDKLAQLELFILTKVPDARLRSMVDTGELVDRAVAERAGIGWSAKNCAIITPEFGSYVYLGEMITNIPFAPDEPMEDQCLDCTLCLDACPTGALIQGGQLDARRCIAFLTQTKQAVPEEFRQKIGNRLYGCDTCQTICPKNKGMNHTHQPGFTPDPALVKPLLLPLLSLSNRQFKEQYGHMSGSWRGKNPIQRNALIALGHFKDESAVPELVRLLAEDPRPMIRGTAAWALGRIGTAEAEVGLHQGYIAEQEATVKEEIDRAIKQLQTN
ncbi:tRNA epoxyqueuosine(34) reductase QueG [Sporosarcina sp.]|uniref:tRNA epoxyqueuosine(34) reductase QueG n=1 Tax=Sporosarcina sp. TaxID=49982 RepID=UPI002604B13B|nr:tRNA epoxyqueuosine(34) reductase QueG [Sporosarcina sp.]